MPTPQDEEFIRFGVAGGHLTQEEADEALSALAEIEKLGGAASAPSVLERRGLLDKRQIGLIHEAVASSKPATKVPKVLAQFELLEALGQGGTGTVFKARQKVLDRIVAVKVLAPRLARDEKFVARFRREARAAARLTHPNIVAAIDVGESEGFYYFATEYVEGETLAQMLAREGRLDEGQALAIAVEVAAALDHAHSKGVLHRDIKPENIMIANDGRVRVTDFGLAKAVGRDVPSGSGAERFLGNPAYLAPEEIRAEADIDCRADIYSLGITLFQMLTGDVPFKGATPMAVSAAAVAEPVPSVRSLVPDARIATSRVVERMVAKDRAERFATPADVHAALRSAAGAPRAAAKAVARPRAARPQAKGAAPRRPGPRPRKSKVGTYIVTAIGIGIHVALFFWLFPKAIRRWEKRQETRGSGPAVVTPITPRPSVPVVPRTSTPPPAVDEKQLLKDIQRALDRAIAFATSSPDACATRVARLRRAVNEFSGEKRRWLPSEGLDVLAALRNELRRAESALATAAKAELGKRRTRADEHFKAGRVADALRAFDNFPAELTSETTSQSLARVRRELHDRALDEFKSRDAKAKGLVKQGHFDQAKSIYMAIKAWDIPEIAGQADAQIRSIDREIARRAAAATKTALDAYPKLAQDIVRRLAARDYKAVRKLVDTAVVDPRLAPIRGKLRPFQDMVRAAGEVWAQVGTGIRKLEPGDTVRMGGVGAGFIRVEGEKVYVQAGGAVAARPLTDLNSSEAVALARSGFGSATPQVELKLGLFLLADRDYRGARARLLRAKKQGADAAVALDLLGRIAPRPCATCKGAKGIECPECGGKGYTDVQREPCAACNHRGWFLCRKCRGRGSLTCANCGGRGYIAGGFRCMQCYGKGRLDCPNCKRGRLKCKKCKGTGTVTTYTVCERCKGKKKIACTQCGARGYLPPLDLPAPGK